MNFMFPSRFIASLMAVTIAATTFSAVPVYADRDRDRDRTARAVATVLGLAVVGKIIHDHNKGRSDDRAVVRRPDRGTGHGVRVHPRPLPRRVERAAVPGHCFRSFQTRRGSVGMLSRHCLERNYRAVNHLPYHCQVYIRTHRGVRSGFDAQCLRRNGFRVSRG